MARPIGLRAVETMTASGMGSPWIGESCGGPRRGPRGEGEILAAGGSPGKSSGPRHVLGRPLRAPELARDLGSARCRGAGPSQELEQVLWHSRSSGSTCGPPASNRRRRSGCTRRRSRWASGPTPAASTCSPCPSTTASPDGYLPSPLVLGGAMAARTSRIRAVDLGPAAPAARPDPPGRGPRRARPHQRRPPLARHRPRLPAHRVRRCSARTGRVGASCSTRPST